MKLYDIIQLFNEHKVLGTTIILFIVFHLIEIAPITISPWTFLRNFLNNWLNNDIKNSITALNDDIKKLNFKLDNHINESIKSDIRQRRSLILRSAAAIIDGWEYNEEHLEFLIRECDAYKQYCILHKINNGVTDTNMNVIYKEYKRVLEKKGGH